MIDDSGTWWKGENFDDLAEYLRVLVTQDGDPLQVVKEPSCVCGGRVFRLHRDATEGVARRTCAACGAKAFICDSGDYWSEARPRLVKCVCGDADLQLAVGFSLLRDGEVRWITVGVRCVSCGVLGSPVDWKISYAPSDHLLQLI